MADTTVTTGKTIDNLDTVAEAYPNDSEKQAYFKAHGIIPVRSKGASVETQADMKTCQVPLSTLNPIPPLAADHGDVGHVLTVVQHQDADEIVWGETQGGGLGVPPAENLIGVESDWQSTTYDLPVELIAQITTDANKRITSAVLKWKTDPTNGSGAATYWNL